MLRQINNKSKFKIQNSKINDINAVFLCLLSAILLAIPFNNGKFWILAWFGFVPLFFALENKVKIKAFFFCYLTGIVFWSLTIYWLIHVTLAGMTILILYLALYFGFFGLILSCVYPLSAIRYPLFISSVWVLLEYMRSHLFTGFPWALLGYSQYLNLPIIQIADITGVWGVSFLVMMGNVAVKEVLSSRYLVLGQKRQVMFAVINCILFISVSFGYGYYRLNQTPNTKHQTPIKISVIQGNIPQEIKWDIKAKDSIINKYFNFATLAAKDRPDLIIWPEASLPVIPQEEPAYFERVKYFVKEIDIPLLLGTVTSKDNFYYNSAISISKEGDLLAQYDKIHLVPFGEYIPLKKIFGFLETVVPIGEFTAGKDYKVFTTGNRQTKFSVLICFEDVFPELSRRFVKKDVDFLVNITNDAWFKKTSAPYQHLQASVFRAIENRVFLMRSANTGVSAFIAPSGRIISQVSDNYGKNIFIDGYDTEEIVIPERKLSFYTRYGDIFIIFCVGTVLILIIKRPFKRVTFALGID